MRPVLVAAALILALYAFHVVRFVEYVNDDAYISFRYSRNLATGVGPYFNPDQPVEGYTNLSLVLAMALVHRVAGDAAVPIAAKALGALAAAATLLLVLAAARRFAHTVDFSRREGLIWGTLAAGLVAASPGFVVNSVSGLETALLAACLTAVAWCDSGEQGRWWAPALWLGVAALTRPEAVVVAGVYLAFRIGQAYVQPTSGADRKTAPTPGRRASEDVHAPARILLALTLVLAAQVLFRYLTYDGELLPNTYHAKSGGFWGKGAWSYVHAGALTPLLGLGGGFLALLGWLAPGRPRRPMLPVAAATLTGVSLPFVTGTDWMIGWRFSAPYLPLLALTVVFGWVRLTGIGVRRRERLATALLVALPLAWFAQAAERTEIEHYVTTKARGYQNGHRAAAEWILNDGAQPGDLIALMDIGIVSWVCGEQRILDITGLTDRVIARSPGSFLDKQYDPSYVLEQKPDFIVLAYVVGGQPELPPPLGAPVVRWNDMEARLAEHPEFKRWYPESHHPAVNDDWRGWYARRLGAAAVFWHDEPEIHYLLAVYRRQQAPASGGHQPPD